MAKIAKLKYHIKGINKNKEIKESRNKPILSIFMKKDDKVK